MNRDDPQDAQDFHHQFNEVWGNPRGLLALTIVNHTTIGLRFMVTGGVFFLLGGLLAMLIRTQLALPGHDLLTPEIYNQVFTMHGTIMMFLFAVPVMEGFAIYLIPKMIGARDLVFPRLSAFGYWCYLFGGIILTSSLVMEIAPASGWFMYTPLSSSVYSPGPGSDFWLLGITFVEISAVSAGIELVVSIMRTRTRGMGLQHMPLFVWYILAMALMIVFGFPPLILGSILLELERAAGMPFFAVAGGGDPILWQHLFWLFGHPEVYILFLPAAGIISTILPVFARRPIAGYRWVVLAIITTGFISFGLWVHHMFTVGIPHLAQAFFSAASMMVAIPTAIQVFAWLATLWSGRPTYEPPMLWALGFLFVFVAGGLTGVMLALVPFDWQVHDTHFVVAHFHFVLVGGVLFPLMAGIYYWLPHFSGRMPHRLLSRWGFWLMFIGFNITFIIMHVTGLLGMPRRVYTFDPGLGWDLPNLISSVGSFIMAAGVATCLLDIVLHFRFGERAKRNPWGADTLEWTTSLPPSAYNFATLPECATRHPLWDNPDLQSTIEHGHHDLATIDHGRRETWGSDPVTGKVREIIHLPGNSWLPFLAALATAALCISLLSKQYSVAIVAALISVAFLLRWSWENGAHPKAAPNAEVVEGDPPLHSRTHDGPGLWGMTVTLLANGSLFMSMLFGWLYLWTVAPQWQFPENPPLSWHGLLFVGLPLSAALFWFKRVVKQLKQDNTAQLQLKLWGICGLGAIHLLAFVAVLVRAPLAPTQSAHDAIITVMLIYLFLHSTLAVVLCALQALRVRKGYVGKMAPYEPVVVEKWWVYTAAVFWITYVVVVILPPLWSLD
ncbi:cytochrome c oxidase subunit I [Gilvimarinus sp. DA14]|uniref:cytochrome c oxidase subunit I n=1 Tax=Gilvimarinus sp. DA14 TaxID=2956798 RepID=UPI0020B7B06D|nr:cytochrome c oxidase subunit I [Gilvimarinus sp. DA14]UTF60209.1 cytochrome c oxidase subunit I [Gilvimarinus sp. DA14]